MAKFSPRQYGIKRLILLYSIHMGYLMGIKVHGGRRRGEVERWRLRETTEEEKGEKREKDEKETRKKERKEKKGNHRGDEKT